MPQSAEDGPAERKNKAKPPDSIASVLIRYRRAGLTFTQTWTTANSLDSKVELEDKITKGLKTEFLANFVPHSQAYGARTNFYYKQPNMHSRLFIDLMKGPTATVDAVIGQQGFLVGGEAGYDVQKAAITRYSAAVGYAGVSYSATLQAANSFSLFSAAYYHKVNSMTEAGAKAVWDSKAGNNVGLEVASKYRLDPTSFIKVRDYRSFCRSPPVLTESSKGQDQRSGPRCPCVQRRAPRRPQVRHRCGFRHAETP